MGKSFHRKREDEKEERFSIILYHGLKLFSNEIERILQIFSFYYEIWRRKTTRMNGLSEERKLISKKLS